MARHGNKLVGTSGLVAIYISEGTEDVYEPDGMRGRVMGAVLQQSKQRPRQVVL